MYRGFNLKLKPTLIEIERYRERGLHIYNSDRKIIEKTIENFKNTDGSINGSKLQASWFPTVNTDVFISHSHKDKDDIALTLAGWLSVNFGVKAFIDSCIWGYSDELLELIDKK